MYVIKNQQKKLFFFFRILIDKRKNITEINKKFLLSYKAKFWCNFDPTYSSERANLLVPKASKIKNIANGKLVKNVINNFLKSLL